MAFFLSCAVLLFPWVLRTGWTFWWILSVIFLVIIGTLWPTLQIIKVKSENDVMTSEQKVSGENDTIQEYIGETQEDQECIGETQEDQECIGETQEDQETVVKNVTDQISILHQCPSRLDKVMSIEELIDLGFKAKHMDNFEQAASYFSHALSLDPMPDIAFYLILDCYWLWNNLGERKFALTKLDGHIKAYLPLFNFEHRNQFIAWMTKENIFKN